MNEINETNNEVQFDLNPQKLAILQAVWGKIKHVVDLYPGACIAGGYVRDVICGKTPKDIDVFVPPLRFPLEVESSHEAVKEITVEVQRTLGFKEVTGCRYMSQNEVQRVWNTEVFVDFAPVQVIELAPGLTLKERIYQHDFGICQCWFDATGLHVTKAFVEDFINETLTLLVAEDEKQYDRSLRRAERFKGKFPGWKFIDTVGHRFSAWLV